MVQQKIKILYQPLKAKWYRMIESGFKREEYREPTAFWCKRFVFFDTLLFAILDGEKDMNLAGYTHVQFSLGYPKNGDESRRMTFELKAIEYREGREEWGAEKGKKYLVMVLGRRTTLDGTKILEVNDDKTEGGEQ